MTVITLSDFEILVCTVLAKKRREINRANNVTEHNYGPQSRSSEQILYQSELDGVGAEFAVAKLLNLYPDFSTNPRSGSAELVTHKNKRIDVKQTVYAHGHLIANNQKKIGEADLYILVIGTIPTFEIVGWCYENELITPGNLTTKLGHAPTYTLSRDKLRELPHCIWASMKKETIREF